MKRKRGSKPRKRVYMMMRTAKLTEMKERMDGKKKEKAA